MLVSLPSKLIDGIQVRQIPNYLNYCVSSHGDVWSDKRNTSPGRWLKKLERDDGYFKVNLWNERGQKSFLVQYLVILCWFGGQQDLKNYVLHGNGEYKDNCCLNLRYGTQKENMEDAIKHGAMCRGEKSGKAKLDDEQAKEVFKRAKAGEDLRILAEEFFVSEKTIWRILHGYTRKHLQNS